MGEGEVDIVSLQLASWRDGIAQRQVTGEVHASHSALETALEVPVKEIPRTVAE